MTSEDREEAKRLAGKVSNLPRAWVAEEIADGHEVKAIKIYSAFLEDNVWLLFDRSFIPADGVAIYYAEELPLK